MNNDNQPIHSDDVLTNSADSSSWWWRYTARTPSPEERSFPPWLHEVDTNEISKWSNNGHNNEILGITMQDLITHTPTILDVNKPTYQQSRNPHLKNNLRQPYLFDRHANGKTPIHHNKMHTKNPIHYPVDKYTINPLNFTRTTNHDLNTYRRKNSKQSIEKIVNSQNHLSEQDKIVLINYLANSDLSSETYHKHKFKKENSKYPTILSLYKNNRTTSQQTFPSSVRKSLEKTRKTINSANHSKYTVEPNSSKYTVKPNSSKYTVKPNSSKYTVKNATLHNNFLNMHAKNSYNITELSRKPNVAVLGQKGWYMVAKIIQVHW